MTLVYAGLGAVLSTPLLPAATRMRHLPCVVLRRAARARGQSARGQRIPAIRAPSNAPMAGHLPRGGRPARGEEGLVALIDSAHARRGVGGSGVALSTSMGVLRPPATCLSRDATLPIELPLSIITARPIIAITGHLSSLIPAPWCLCHVPLTPQPQRASGAAKCFLSLSLPHTAA